MFLSSWDLILFVIYEWWWWWWLFMCSSSCTSPSSWCSWAGKSYNKFSKMKCKIIVNSTNIDVFFRLNFLFKLYMKHVYDKISIIYLWVHTVTHVKDAYFIKKTIKQPIIIMYNYTYVRCIYTSFYQYNYVWFTENMYWTTEYALSAYIVVNEVIILCFNSILIFIILMFWYRYSTYIFI